MTYPKNMTKEEIDVIYNRNVVTSKQEFIEKVLKDIFITGRNYNYSKYKIVLENHLPEESPSDIGEKIEELIEWYKKQNTTFLSNSHTDNEWFNMAMKAIVEFMDSAVINKLTELKDSLSITK